MIDCTRVVRVVIDTARARYWRKPLQTVNTTPVAAMIKIQVSFQRMALIAASVALRSPIVSPAFA